MTTELSTNDTDVGTTDKDKIHIVQPGTYSLIGEPAIALCGVATPYLGEWLPEYREKICPECWERKNSYYGQDCFQC